jgi:glycosyltransferase involved in cell wall biosynthesis
MPGVTVAICTCERPVDLRRLLDSLARLDCNEQVSIAVVENGSRREGEAVCASLMTSYRWPLRCVVEPRRGISYARNAAVKAALENEPDFIAMVDDDEQVDPRWLSELLRVQRQFSADVVSGPVIPVFSQSPPKWIERGRFFERPRMLTGSPTGATRTGNILFRTSVFRSQVGPWFDDGFALTGGEDSLFLRKLDRGGFRMVWADEAVVYETVMPSRMTERWLIQRAFRGGATYSRILRRIQPAFITSVVLVGKALPQLALGALFWLTTFVSITHRVRAAMMMAKASGKIVAILGGRYDEYASIHKSA